MKDLNVPQCGAQQRTPFKKLGSLIASLLVATTWSTEALARVEHNRLKSVLSVAQVQVPKKVWCATASDTWLKQSSLRATV